MSLVVPDESTRKLPEKTGDRNYCDDRIPFPTSEYAIRHYGSFLICMRDISSMNFGTFLGVDILQVVHLLLVGIHVKGGRRPSLSMWWIFNPLGS